jgi:hypothetical protein
MSPKKSLVAVMASIAALAAVAPAAATAEPIDPPGSTVNAVAPPPQPSNALPLGVVRATGGANSTAGTGALEQPGAGTAVASAKSGFDWGDAAIGATAMLALLSAGTGLALIARRGRGRGQPAPTG